MANVIDVGELWEWMQSDCGAECIYNVYGIDLTSDNGDSDVTRMLAGFAQAKDVGEASEHIRNLDGMDWGQFRRDAYQFGIDVVLPGDCVLDLFVSNLWKEAGSV